MSRKLNDLSRAVSHALRHEPWLYELELDEEGWTSVDALIAALQLDRLAKCDARRYRGNDPDIVQAAA
ncbi:MAG TPA: RNA 2'-phosphotransferase [Reyranella sp.]|nr:RNA 2'-phosphotransferase [Reyranella sp.]